MEEVFLYAVQSVVNIRIICSFKSGRICLWTLWTQAILAIVRWKFFLHLPLPLIYLDFPFLIGLFWWIIFFWDYYTWYLGFQIYLLWIVKNKSLSFALFHFHFGSYFSLTISHILLYLFLVLFFSFLFFNFWYCFIMEVYLSYHLIFSHFFLLW